MAYFSLKTLTKSESGQNLQFTKKSKKNTSKSAAPLALVMKGGGIKGLAYVGAIEVLEQKHKFNWFIGTSAGAIVAILLGAGYTTEELKEILENKNFKDFFDAKWYQKPGNLIFRYGLHPAETFTSWLDELLAKKLNSYTRVRLSELPNRVTVYASRRGMSALKFDSVDNDVDAAYAARCSMSIPWVFIPQAEQGFRTYDGGIQNNYPVNKLLEDYPDTAFKSLFLGSEVYEPIKQKSVLKDLIAIVTQASEPETIKRYCDDTIIIDPRPIRTLDFSLTSDEKEFLLLAGQTAGLAHLDNSSEEYNNSKQKRDEYKKQLESARKLKRNRRLWISIIISVIFLSLIVFGSWKLLYIDNSEIKKPEDNSSSINQSSDTNSVLGNNSSKDSSDTNSGINTGPLKPNNNTSLSSNDTDKEKDVPKNTSPKPKLNDLLNQAVPRQQPFQQRQAQMEQTPCSEEWLPDIKEDAKKLLEDINSLQEQVSDRLNDPTSSEEKRVALGNLSKTFSNRQLKLEKINRIDINGASSKKICKILDQYSKLTDELDDILTTYKEILKN